jgi:hypothetical protein
MKPWVKRDENCFVLRNVDVLNHILPLMSLHHYSALCRIIKFQVYDLRRTEIYVPIKDVPFIESLADKVNSPLTFLPELYLTPFLEIKLGAAEDSDDLDRFIDLFGGWQEFLNELALSSKFLTLKFTETEILKLIAVVSTCVYGDYKNRSEYIRFVMGWFFDKHDLDLEAALNGVPVVTCPSALLGEFEKLEK